MRDLVVRRPRRVRPWVAVGVLLVNLLSGSALVRAATDPPPDPAGLATGDKSSAFDGAGTAFVVAELTDKADPDYATKKRALDEYQAQAIKEPLALKLADSVGHVRVATNAAWTLNTASLSCSCRPDLPCSRAAWCAGRMPPT
jgi:hypothetical protein